MRSMGRVCLVCAVLALSGCANPRVQENMAQAMTDFGNQLSGIQQDVSLLQTTVDSLREVVAKQDTLIRHLASLSGVPVK